MSARNTPAAERPEILALDTLDTEQRLDYLLHLLLQLPQVPVSSDVYRFHKLKITAEDIICAGSHEGAVHKAIQDMFGEADSYEELDIQFRERGEGLEGIVPLIRSGLGGKSKMLVKELRRWVDILLSSAISHFSVRELPIPPAKRARKAKVPFDVRPLSLRQSAPPSRAGSAVPSRAGSAAPPNGSGPATPSTHAKRRADGPLDDVSAKRAKAGDNASGSAVQNGAADTPLELDSGDESEPVRVLGTGSARRKTIVIDDDIEMYAADDDDGGEVGGEGTAPKSKKTNSTSRQAAAKPSATAGKKKTSTAPKKPTNVAPIFKQATSSGTVLAKVKAKGSSTTKKRKPTKVVSDNETEAFTSEDESDGDGAGNGSDDEDTAPVLSKKQLKAAKSDHAQARRWRWTPEELTDCDEPAPRTVNGKRRGRPPIQIVRDLTIPCRVRATGKRRYRCSQPNCIESFSGRQKERVLPHHINECRKIDPSLKAQAIEVMSGNSLGAQLERAVQEEDGSAVAGPSAGAFRQPTLTELAQAGGKAHIQTRFDFAVMCLFTTCALAGNILDLRVWTDFVHAANPRLDTFSSTTLHDIHIAQEAVGVRKLAVDRLRTCDNLTISYDGGTVKIVQSVYTVHVTEPRSHESYFLRGDESSGLSHTGEYIRDLVLGVMDEIGRERFVCVVSDSTGSTKSAREQVQATVVTIIALGDAPHALNNLIKDICGLAHFSLCISNSRKMNKFVKLSSLATQRIKSQAQRDGVTRHLESAGKTRFAGVNRLGYSILRNLPSIKTLVDNGVLFTGPKEHKNYSFLRVTSQYHNYDLTLRQLVAVLTPFAKAIKCLESSLIHPGHVYLFWLAAIATLHDVFTTSEDSLGFPPEIIQQITGIVNDRFEAMCEGSDNTVYKATLFLDPVYILSKLWRTPGATGTLSGADLGVEVPFYREIGQFLLQLLLKHVESDRQAMQKRFGAPKAIAQAFQVQFSAYARQEFPFNRDRSHGWRNYWAGLAENPDGRVIAFLAVKLLSMLPTSMPEERTMSAITKAESGGRSGMKVTSLVAEVQVKQHYARLERTEKKSKRATPRVQKFRELAAQIRAEVMSGPDNIFLHPAKPSSTHEADGDDGEDSKPAAETTTSVTDALDELEDHEVLSGTELRGLSFAIAGKVDICSSVLLDLLSDVPRDKAESTRRAGADECPPAPDDVEELAVDAADFEFSV